MKAEQELLSGLQTRGYNARTSRKYALVCATGIFTEIEKPFTSGALGTVNQ